MIRFAADENLNDFIVRGLLRRRPDLDILRTRDTVDTVDTGVPHGRIAVLPMLGSRHACDGKDQRHHRPRGARAG